MMTQEENCYIGIDISKEKLDIFILPQRKYIQLKNTEQGIKKLITKMKLFSLAAIVMEATGGYEKPVSYALASAGLRCAVVNPRQIRDFAKALGILAKTDRIDAEVIALFAKKVEPKDNVIADKNQQKLTENSARRRQLIDMIGMEKNRLDKASKELKKSINRIIKALEKELKAIDETLKATIQQDPSYQQKDALLRSIKGVGSITASGLLANMPELGQVSAKQISALAGLAPFNCDSGTLRGKRKIWGGRASVRSGLYMAALVAIRHNKRIKSFYERLCNAGKKKKVAIVACMRKMLIVMNAMIKNGQPWQEAMVI